MFVRAAEELGVRTDLLINLGAVMDEAVAAGHSDAALAAIHDVLGSNR